jgi:hypothetical protein
LLDPAIQLGVSNATVTVNGNIEADLYSTDDLEITGTLINQTAINQNLEIRTNNGYLHANVTDLYVGPIAGAVKIDENSISTTDATQLTIEGFTNSADMTTAINTAESNANAYTDTRETAITSAYQTYADQSEADAITTSNSYADTAIANLVDSAPATLDTLNELAAALGDDPNFATTVTNSIATKWTQDNTKISNWDTAYSWGDHSVEGYITGYTETDPVFLGHVASSITSTEITNWNTAYGWGDHSIVGYLTDYTVTEADVTAHQAALSITESQISDLDHYTDSDARTAISLSSSNVNELSYDNTTGVITYVSPTTVAATGQVVIDVRNTSGVAISRGDAVYLAGHSGNKILVALADANATGEHPAIGLANSAMANNTDGTVLIQGEMASIDTSAFAVNDVLYVSETAGALTATRPSSENTAVQNMGKVARSDNSNGLIIVTGAGRENDVPNLATGHVFIGNGTGYDKRALTTSDVAEGTNLYYTDARAISAVENEATLDLTGDVTIAQDLDVTGLIKINDGYVLGSFNPYAGFGGATMNTSIMGVGQESGWAGMTVRSRGEHDWGLSGFGIPPEAPRALLALQGGRLDGSSDDYLNSGDKFAEIMFNPYSDYRTGTEWLTPSAMIEGIATENHSSSGLGTKLVLKTTTNGAFAGAQSPAHTDGEITIQGTTVSTNGTLKLDDDVIITGTTEFQGNLSSNGSQLVVDDAVKINGSASTKNTIIGDSTIGAYNIHGVTVNAGDEAWAGISLVETTGGASKPINNFSNPSFSTTIFGGTEASKTGVESGKRIFSAFALASQDGTTPSTANFRFLSETTEQQSSTARGANFKLETTENGSTATTVSLVVQGDTLTVNQNGNGKITSGGNLILDDDVQVTGTLDVDGQTNLKGNVTLGDANTDVITATGKLKASNGFKNTVLDTNTANYLANVLGIVETGDQGYISDGNNGSPCMAFYDGSNWKKMHDPANNIANS